MNVLVAGSGVTAERIAEYLMSSHRVTSLREADEVDGGFHRMEVATVLGAPTSPEALRNADVAHADAFVGATHSDEQNIVACLAAKKLGAKRCICVLSRPGFLSLADSGQDLADSLGIDMIVRPGEQLAQEILRIVLSPGALDARAFLGGRVSLARYPVETDAPIAGTKLRDLRLPKGVVLVSIKRDQDVVVPQGETRLTPGDQVVAMGEHESVDALSALLRKGRAPFAPRAAIVGAGSVGVAIARGLRAANWQVKLIEVDRDRCSQVAGEVDCMVLHGDGADLQLLEQEQIDQMPVVVCVTNNDEKNLLVSLLAKTLGVPRIITRADRLSNETMFEKVGVDVVLSARGAAVRSIVQHVDDRNSEIRAILEHGAACVIELKLPANFRRRRLRELRPPEAAVVGAITRGRKVIIPSGNDELVSGDDVLVFCRTANEHDVTDFFMHRQSVAEH